MTRSNFLSLFLIPRTRKTTRCKDMYSRDVLIGCFLVLEFMHSGVSQVAGGQCFPGLFIFGDSMVDVGNAIAAYPDRFSRIEQHPYGVEWPQHGADRFSDGKLFGDLSAWAIGHSPSSAYLRSVQTLLYSGANFAAAGSTVLDEYPPHALSDPNFVLTRTPFTLETQVQWWQRFKVRVSFSLTSGQGTTTLIPSAAFNRSLHLVLMGATDYLLQYTASYSEHKILASVHVIVSRIAANLETLYKDGAQTILVINLPPLGCTPAFLSMIPGQKGSSDYDSFGCLTKVNTAILRHNQLLYRAVSRLQKKYPASKFVYADFYQAAYEIVKDPHHYGLDTSTLMTACCGVGGAYNFNPNATCGRTWLDGKGAAHNVTTCQDPSKHLTWDGYHFSQAVTRIAALSFFQGKHVYPSMGLLPNNCQANFTMFWAYNATASPH
ncbi:hypothetical protein MPTK1_1g12050 [Marchantia polymorpha subsp. ruderalis]|uniref:GDSL esterase/lipase n=2 Tax=Marchantia polymorpha TaxID=3197 RepID=A0AAF6AP82_MARPO|nr:hypothetical protein MARPO_0014s0023 [Marchantia polymorpha]BBM98252.1 hypothetical protein Mp_1g12050 [Marchantia polymorpha subsp. ruderalis]|eukprot:PTQ45468.1 hypothetical protein MARPO_0014s0023 [Marchantia polymorpha]